MLGDILDDTAVPVKEREDEAGDWIEGERDVTHGDPALGTPFDCVLFLPQGEESNTPKGQRNVKRPTLLYEPEDQEGAVIALSHKTELLVTSPRNNAAQGLAEDTAVRYQVQGSPQPLGKPTDDALGFQAILRTVDD